MKSLKIKTTILSALITMLVTPAFADASSVADQLGKNLTPLGGNAAANADGSIPAWTGGLKNSPAEYQDGEPLVSPFPEDHPLFEITAENWEDYAGALTEGQIAMLKRYPETFRLPIYQTRRTAHVPDRVARQARENAVKASLTADGNGVDAPHRYYPFPVPEKALEVLWNHFMRYRGGSLQRDHTQIISQRGGGYYGIGLSEIAAYPEMVDGFDPEEDRNILVFFKQRIESPARLTGNVLLVHDTINQVAQGRNAWVYNAGQRRVRRAPQVAYDGPGTAADGLRTADNFDMYTGAPDRYEWNLVGKQELYIPYNNYRLQAPETTYDDLVLKGHLNPDYLRYEKHRVWKIEARLKDGERHIYARRTFYFDEDTWQIAYIDQYDGRDQLWRISEGFHVQYYQAETPWLAGEAIYDLNAGRFLAMGLHSESEQPIRFGKVYRKGEFSPAALRREGKR